MMILKRILSGLLILVILAGILLVTPRVWSALNPEKPPLGYFYLMPGYLAAGLGLDRMINMNPEVPSDVEQFKDIEYKTINGKSLRLDIYRPRNITKPSPLLVFIHGGSWSHGKRSDYMVYMMAFAKQGYMTATVSYRLLQDGPYPACAEDITDAVQWLYGNGEKYGYNPDRIALVGGSAGAHLALLAAYEWRKPGAAGDTSAIPADRHHIKAVVDIYGPVDLTTEYAQHQRLVNNLIAHPYSETPYLYLEASPIHYLNKNNPPTMILHGTSDDLVPISQSDLLKARLDSLGVPCVYYRVPGWPHAMDVVERVNEFSRKRMSDFFAKYL
jgi:acetyl esterase/lipase